MRWEPVGLRESRAKGVSERGQILVISPAHSGTMVQEIDEIWAA
jgi:hypothetical protein